jgi:hypothetical protein
MAVGIEDAAHLAAVQKRRLAEASRAKPGQAAMVPHRTRHMPRRAAEILDGGSLYWVIKGAIRARQRILRVERQDDGDGRPYCGLDPELVETRPRPVRPFQGWRYLESADAAPDLERAMARGDQMPPELAAELRALGLL